MGILAEGFPLPLLLDSHKMTQKQVRSIRNKQNEAIQKHHHLVFLLYCDSEEAEWWQPLLREECEIKLCCRPSTAFKDEAKKRDGVIPL